MITAILFTVAVTVAYTLSRTEYDVHLAKQAHTHTQALSRTLERHGV